jgi:hypothetical protein
MRKNTRRSAAEITLADMQKNPIKNLSALERQNGLKYRLFSSRRHAKCTEKMYFSRDDRSGFSPRIFL